MAPTSEVEKTIIGLNQSLDKNYTDQNLRLILADCYDELGITQYVECLRWMAKENKVPFIWFQGSEPFAGWVLKDYPYTLKFMRAYQLATIPTLLWEVLPSGQPSNLKTTFRHWKFYTHQTNARRTAEEALYKVWSLDLIS